MSEQGTGSNRCPLRRTLIVLAMAAVLHAASQSQTVAPSAEAAAGKQNTVTGTHANENNPDDSFEIYIGLGQAF